MPSIGGVGGAAVQFLDAHGLRCFYSEFAADLASDSDSLKRSALECHAVTRDLFQRSAIIPFRFPTTLISMAELDAYLERYFVEYHAALAEFADKVQIDIRIRATAPPPQASSGTGYLKTRAERGRSLQTAADTCRIAIAQEMVDWRQRKSDSGVRCFVLIRRDADHVVRQKIKNVRLDESVNALLSGPWPPTEFLPKLS